VLLEQEYDVVIWSETHLGYSDNLHIDGYSYFPVCRNVSSNGKTCKKLLHEKYVKQMVYKGTTI
jgi:hypothetical protein